MFLHAWKMDLPHPISGEKLALEAPLPNALAEFLSQLSIEEKRIMGRRFDLLVFDWDGTLFDSTGVIVQALQASCRDVGLPEPSDEQASHVIGLGLAEALRTAAPELLTRSVSRC